jgi:hypothetical protein
MLGREKALSGSSGSQAPRPLSARDALRYGGPMETDLFAAFKPDADALLRQMSQYIDDAALERIAKFDILGGRQRIDFIAHHLQMLRDTCTMPNPISGDLTDSLTGCICFEPDVDRVQRHKDRRHLTGHWERAYACTIMLRAYGHAVTRGTAENMFCNKTLIQLLGSLPFLDVNFEAELTANLAWLVGQTAQDRDYSELAERPFLGVALLSLAANAKAISDAVIIELAKWLVSEERRTPIAGEGFADHWLLRRAYNIQFTTAFFTSAAQKWTALGSDLASFKAKGPRGDAVREIGQLLSRQTRVS